MITKALGAAAYLRRSTDRQEQSIDDQRRAVERYAQERGVTIVRTYTDDAISGADTDARKAFLRMIADAKQKDRPFDRILVYDVSRFGRVGADEAGYYRHTLAQAGVEVVYVAEGLRGDQTDDLLLGVKQFVAHQTVVDLSKVTIRGQVSRVEKGRWCGGRPPYGFDLQYVDQIGVPYQTVRFLESGEREQRAIDGTLIRVVPRGSPLPVTKKDAAHLIPGDPVRVGVVRRIFEEYVLQEAGYASIAARLNRDGIPTAVGAREGSRWKGTWSQGTVREILRNPAYRGATAWNRISYAKFHRVEKRVATARAKFDLGKVKRNREEDWIVTEGTHEPLVTPALFARAQQMMKSRSGVVRDAMRAAPGCSPYLLSGLVTCARCGGRWQGYKTAKGRKKPGEKRIETFYYACASYVTKGNAVCNRALVRQDAFEAAVTEEVARQVHGFVETGGADRLEALLDEATQAAEAQAREKQLAETLRMRETKIEELVGCLSPALAPMLEPKILALRDEVEAVRLEMDGLRTKRLDVEQARDDVKRMVQGLEGVAQVLQSGTLLERREILRGLIQGIVLDPTTGAATITFFEVPRTPCMPAEDGGATSEGRDVVPGNGKSTSHCDPCSQYLMAGAGFEPATSGL